MESDVIHWIIKTSAFSTKTEAYDWKTTQKVALQKRTCDKTFLKF